MLYVPCLSLRAPIAWPTSWVAWFWNIVMSAAAPPDSGSTPGVFTAIAAPPNVLTRFVSGVPTVRPPPAGVVPVARMMIQLSPMYQDVFCPTSPGEATLVHGLVWSFQYVTPPNSGSDLR